MNSTSTATLWSALGTRELLLLSRIVETVLAEELETDEGTRVEAAEILAAKTHWPSEDARALLDAALADGAAHDHLADVLIEFRLRAELVRSPELHVEALGEIEARTGWTVRGARVALEAALRGALLSPIETKLARGLPGRAWSAARLESRAAHEPRS